jgi:hypothetical protein
MQEWIGWISVFFRKNLYTISSLVGFLFILFVIINPFHSKQISNENSLQTLKKESKQLKKENADLKSEKTFYMDKTEKLKQDLESSNTSSSEMIVENQKRFELLQSLIKNELVHTLSIFSPAYTEKGDKIAGLTVTDVVPIVPENGSKGYNVNFTGEFVVKGTLNESSSRGYFFQAKENVEKIPHSLQEFDGLSFYIRNYDDEWLKELESKLGKKPPFNQVEIEAVFKNYSYCVVSETDLGGNGAEFVRLISQN